MRKLYWLRAGALLALGACSGSAAGLVQPGTSGLVGTVRLGPIQPVCRIAEPCDAPLQASFTLRQFSRIVAQFTSDQAGRFQVYASPGTYTVVPDEAIGIGRQAPEVTVQATGLTHVDLAFDTGIR